MKTLMPMTPKEMWKQALMSIFIGACVSFITTLMQGLVELLQSIPAEGIGSGVGMAYYIGKVSIPVLRHHV